MVNAAPGLFSMTSVWLRSCAEFGGQHARHVVGRAARSLRNDQPDRLVGIFATARWRNRPRRQLNASEAKAQKPSATMRPPTFRPAA